MNNIDGIISQFSTISLDDMDDVKLMSRTDTKFTFSKDKLSVLLKKLIPFYRVLSINKNLVHDYKSLYYDTEERKFYIDHHNQRVNRNKIRFREYVGSDLTFLEVKLKNNKGKTIKKRIKVDSISKELSKEQQEYIDNVIGQSLHVSAKQWIEFSRITFVNKKRKERLTIDVNLSFSNSDISGNLREIVIAEVKQEKMSRSSEFMKITKEMSILPIRLSKYCMSTLQLNPGIKANRFKRKQLFINKLKNA